MKTTTIIVFFLILFLLGLTLAGLPQGIDNNGGYITGTSSSYIKFSGSGDMSVKSPTADRTVFGNVEVDFTSSSYELAIEDDSYVTIDGNLTLNDSLVIEASSSGMGSLITNGSITGSRAIVEQYLTQDQWHMVSSPVSSAKAEVYAGSYMLKWSEPDSTWSYITSLTEPLNVTQGYFLWSSSSISSPTDVAFRGMINTGDQTVSGLSYNNGSGEGHGWNLVGNPYPSTLEWTSSWTKSGIDATIYVYNGTNYLTWNYNLGGYGTKTDGSIPPTQGFWVKANSSSPSLTIPNSERIHSSQAFYKGSEEIMNGFLTITVKGNIHSDQIILGMCESATNQFDPKLDAYKIYGIVESPQMYALAGEDKFCVSVFKPVESKKVIPLGIKAGSDGNYTFTFEGIDGIDPLLAVYLEDKAPSFTTQKLIDLRKTNAYNFNMVPGAEEQRFNIHFIKTGNLNPYETSGLDKSGCASIYAVQKEVYVKCQSDGPARVTVYDLLGKEILSDDILPYQLNRITVNTGSGFYIVKLVTGRVVESAKVFIN